MIAICIPSLGAVSIHWAVQQGQIATGINASHARFMCVGQRVAEARNKLVATVLGHDGKDTEFESIFFLDDDVLCAPGAIIMLAKHNLPIVSGVYFAKNEWDQPLMFSERLKGPMPFVPDKLIPVYGHGMGLTLIKTEVFRRMRDECDLGVDENGNVAWFKTTAESYTNEDGAHVNRRQTEDLFFLEKAREMGYQPHVDTSFHAFGFHYCMKTHRAYPLKQWQEWITKRTLTWETPDGPVIWGKRGAAKLETATASKE